MNRHILKFNNYFFPLYLHDEIAIDSLIKFNRDKIKFTGEPTLELFANEVSEKSVDGAIDWFGDSGLTEESMGSLKLLGISISDFDNSLEIEYSRLRKHFKLVRVDVDKSRWDDFYISAYVLDPLNRGWVVCPGEYLDYWSPSGVNDDLLIEYADLNKITVSSLVE
jgi:hypothetical protein